MPVVNKMVVNRMLVCELSNLEIGLHSFLWVPVFLNEILIYLKKTNQNQKEVP
jgi:hypothetical protein